jgi:acetamidase/formamidase
LHIPGCRSPIGPGRVSAQLVVLPREFQSELAKVFPVDHTGEGALFSVGDAHAAPGHGEVDLSAIETGNRGTFQLIVRKDMKLTWPRAETVTHWIVMGPTRTLKKR